VDIEDRHLAKHKVLVVEDEHDIAQLIRLHLQDIDCEVTLAADGHEGMRQAFAQQWDLVMLDLRLPGPDGLTSKSSELDRVLGLELGADDYVTKPFSVSELMARVKAIFRRVESMGKRYSDDTASITLGPLLIDTAGREVMLNQQPVSLTAREFDLLLHFVRHPGQVFSRAQLLDSVWGYGHEGYEHTVNSHINRLRAKIEQNPSQPEYIVTVWGVGYKLDARPRDIGTNAAKHSNITQLRT